MVATKYTGVKYHDARNGIRMYYIQYKLNGKVKREKVGSKAEGVTPMYCKKLRDKKIVELRHGDDAPAQTKTITSKTLAEVSTEFFERDDLRTKSKMQSLYNTHLSHLANEPLNYFDDNAILTLIKKKKKEKSVKTKRLFSPQTINNILTLLSSMLHFAQSKGYTKALPTIKQLKVDNKRERYLTKEEINMLCNEIQTSELVRKRERLLLFVKLSLITGARLGSILGIRGKDINIDNKTIIIKNFKTNNTYTAFLSDDIINLIPPLEPLEPLIDVADSKQIQRPLQAILNKLFNVGLNADDRKDRVVVHTLRHTFASHLAINGTPIQTIMKLMDHKDIDMTLRYSKLMPDSGRSEVENLYG